MTTEYELIHHGILGMKWGVRRYQAYGEGGYNPKHKGKNQLTKEQSHKMRKAARKASIKEHRKQDAKDASMLSDKALDEKVKRLQKERQLKEITEEMVQPGKAFIKKLLKGTTMTVASGVAAYGGFILLQKALGTKVKLAKPRDIALTAKGLKKTRPLNNKLLVSIGKAKWDTPYDIAKTAVKGGFKKK